MTQKSIFCVYSNGMESPLVRYLCFHIRQVPFELFWQLLSLRCLSKEFKTSPKGPWLLLPTKLFAYHFFQVCPLLSVAQLCTEEPGEWGPLGSVWALPRPAHVSQFTMFCLVRHTGCPFSTKGKHLQNGFTPDSKTDRGREKAFLNSHQTSWFKLHIYIFKTSKFFSQHLNVLNSLTQTFQGLINLCKSVLVGHFNRSVLHTSYPHPAPQNKTNQTINQDHWNEIQSYITEQRFYGWNVCLLISRTNYCVLFSAVQLIHF